MVQIFISHTKKDREFCNSFDTVVARVGIKAFRSEFEDIEKPAWRTIKDAINNSVAIFFLVGNELVKNQDYGDSGWRHTQNWIAYEIGLACQKGIDVWAVCDNVNINFPMPYINNYFNIGLERPEAFNYMKIILNNYKNGYGYPSPYQLKPLGVECGYCGMIYNLHVNIPPREIIKCPQCLNDLSFPNGFNPDV
ncbi:MAG: hypothetical protein WA144_12890 [Candidatus Methanoperedens sp.]